MNRYDSILAGLPCLTDRQLSFLIMDIRAEQMRREDEKHVLAVENLISNARQKVVVCV